MIQTTNEADNTYLWIQVLGCFPALAPGEEHVEAVHQSYMEALAEQHRGSNGICVFFVTGVSVWDTPASSSAPEHTMPAPGFPRTALQGTHLPTHTEALLSLAWDTTIPD